MSEKSIVTLNGDELVHIETLLRKGKISARRARRANILRFADEGCTDEEIKESRMTNLCDVFSSPLSDARMKVNCASTNYCDVFYRLCLTLS